MTVRRPLWDDRASWPPDEPPGAFLAKAILEIGPIVLGADWSLDVMRSEVPPAQLPANFLDATPSTFARAVPDLSEELAADLLRELRTKAGSDWSESKEPGIGQRLNERWQDARRQDERLYDSARAFCRQRAILGQWLASRIIAGTLRTFYQAPGKVLLNSLDASVWAADPTGIDALVTSCRLGEGQDSALIFLHAEDLQRELEAYRVQAMIEVQGALATGEPSSNSEGANEAVALPVAPAVLLTSPMYNLYTALVGQFGERGGYRTEKANVRKSAATTWQAKHKPKRPLLPGDIGRGIRHLDERVFARSKSAKIKGN